MIYTRTYQVLAAGNYGLAVSEGTFGDAPTAYCDLFRVENGRIKMVSSENEQKRKPQSSWDAFNKEANARAETFLVETFCPSIKAELPPLPAGSQGGRTQRVSDARLDLSAECVKSISECSLWCHLLGQSCQNRVRHIDTIDPICYNMPSE